MFDQLSAPFHPSAIHWRAQTVTKAGDKALALAYLDARDVMDRLDDACGPANWKDSYFETPKGRTICTLEIRVDGEWIAKSDGSGDTDVEGEKGSISGALKRAAVKWGIGRYLYDLGNVWAPCESEVFNGKPKWRKWKPEAQRAFDDALMRLIPAKPVEKISDADRDEIQAMASGAGVPLQQICKSYDVASLKDLPASQVPEVKKRLQTTINGKIKENANGQQAS